MSDRHVHVTYCDDIRQEVGNKRSLIGVYTRDLFVQAIPVTLPKLGIVVSILTPIDRPFQKLSLRVQQGEAVLISTEDLVAGFKSISEAPLDDLDREIDGQAAPSSLICNIEILLAPFRIDAEHNIRVIATTEDGELRGRALRVRLVKNFGIGNPEVAPKSDKAAGWKSKGSG